MKPLNLILCLAIATHCWAEDNALNNPSISSTGKPVLEIASLIQNQLAKDHLNLGLECCLLNYQEKARYHFRQSIKSDDTCLLAHVGMLMVYPSGSAEYKNELRIVNKLMESAVLTPAEEWYLSTFLQYISGDLQGAAAAFKQRAAVYRRDVMAACWDIILNHYAAEQGTSLIQRADALVERYPDNPLVHYCRALLEEYSSTVSEKALRSAGIASELLHGNPVPQLLAGHLLGRSERFTDAISKFEASIQSASHDLKTISKNDAFVYNASLLCGISAQWQAGNKLEALRKCRSLCSQLPKNILSESEGDILLHWEARTLPLRLLVLQLTAPSRAAINAASKISMAPADDPVKIVQDCLTAALQTRALACSARISSANETLAKAEGLLANLQRLEGDMIRKGGLLLTCYRRAVRACKGAILKAQLNLYSDSTSIWKPHLDELLSQPETRLLPPVLPQIRQK